MPRKKQYKPKRKKYVAKKKTYKKATKKAGFTKRQLSNYVAAHRAKYPIVEDDE